MFECRLSCTGEEGENHQSVLKGPRGFGVGASTDESSKKARDEEKQPPPVLLSVSLLSIDLDRSNNPRI